MWFYVLLLFFYAKTLLAEEDLGLANAFVLFKKGAYLQTIEALDKLEKKSTKKRLSIIGKVSATVNFKNMMMP
ncbi:MAG: hypothetical protein U0T83_09285 [Bacteriovoracaceae bacterium]